VTEISSITDTAKPDQAPVDPLQRIEAVDMVRGFALFGVLLVNMYNFGAYSIIWNETVDEFAFSVMRFFFETKSWRLFSFLFALGFALQLLRAEERGSEFVPVYLRRLFILFIFGAAHSMIYRGDILMHYAELGLLLVLLRKVPLRLLLVLSVCLLAVFPVGRAVTSYLEPTQATPTTDYSVRFEAEKAEMEEARRSHVRAVGSMPEVMADNAKLENPFSEPLSSESSVAVFAMFVLGLYAGRLGIFQDIAKHMQLIRRVFWWGFPIGLVCMAAERILNATTGYAIYRDQQATLLPQLIGDVLFVYGSTLLALGYAAGITLLAQHARARRLLAPLGAAGRMALTVYLSGSVMFGTLFYGFAFGNAFRLGPAAVTGYAVLFFSMQILFCVWWTKRFRFGPMEWLWRALTYMKLPPMRLQEQSYEKG
jgi:uncharacterized protein